MTKAVRRYSDLGEKVSREVRRHTHVEKVPWDRIGYWLIGVFFFVIFSTIALGYSLGYRYNADRGTWQQTGVIRINGPLSGLPLQVVIDGEYVSGTMPVRYNRVLPGTHTIQLTKDGYQPWSRTMELEPNQRISFTDAILIYTKPKEALETIITENDSRFTDYSTRNLEVRNGNELWIEDEFVARRTEDILSPRWFPLGVHVLCQLGDEIVLYDVYGKTTQSLVKLSSSEQVAFFAADGGRRLIVKDAGVIKSFELFETNSLFNRLVVDY